MTKDVYVIIDMDTKVDGKPTITLEPKTFTKHVDEAVKIHVTMKFGDKISSIGCLDIQSQPVYAESPRIIWKR